MELICQSCDAIVELKPVAVNHCDELIFKYECANCGPVIITAPEFTLLNWAMEAVNEKLYPTFKDYIEKILLCTVPCKECPFRHNCYKDFYHEVDKTELKKLVINDPESLP